IASIIAFVSGSKSQDRPGLGGLIAFDVSYAIISCLVALFFGLHTRNMKPAKAEGVPFIFLDASSSA
uniref:hypothetical protein n=1 Tax=Deinococcus alpinitundrae TaxID=468913 RepID=UPI001ED8E134